MGATNDDDEPAGDEHGPFVTKTGKVLTKGELKELVAEAEAGYDPEMIREVRDRRAE